MVVDYTLPDLKITVTHGADTFQLEDYHLFTDVFLMENGISQTIFTALDTQGETFLNKVDIDDNIKVEFQFADAPSAAWKQVFGGWGFDLTPILTDQGEIVRVQARGYGLSLLAMAVGAEYGTESSNPTLDTIREILTNASAGIVDKWVEKVLNTADNSEYTLLTSKSGNETVANIDTSFPYLYWPFVPANKCIDDMIDLISADKKPNAGAHWLVIPDGTNAYLCVDTIGNHADAASLWPTWWNTNQAGSTIEVAKNMIISRFTKHRSEANYILYCGTLKKPANEIWTENKSGDWGFTSVGGAGASVNDDNTTYIVNSYSIRLDTSGQVGGGIEAYYPSGMAANWDVLKWCGEYTIPTFNFYIRRDSNIGIGGAGLTPWLYFHTTDGTNRFAYSLGGLLPQASKWYFVSIPLGPKANIYVKGQQSSSSEVTAMVWGSPVWSDIDYFRFVFAQLNGAQGQVWLDGLHFGSRIIRGARDDTKIGSQKCRIKVINDDIGKDDSGRSGTPGTTDLGMMAQLAKAELYRAVTTPIIGTFCVLGRETILPGQLTHTHFGEKSDGSFNIDSDMRILKVHHRFAPKPHGFRTYLTVTDDVLNSHAMQPHTGYNILKKATNPDYATRERASIKARDIDITLPLLTENYST